jgi:hypothetical protein
MPTITDTTPASIAHVRDRTIDRFLDVLLGRAGLLQRFDPRHQRQLVFGVFG